MYTLSYQIFLMILPVVTLPYISRVLLPYGVGINAWANSFSSYFVLFGVLGLTTYGQREVAVAKNNTKKLKKIFWQIESTSVITTCVAVLSYLLLIVFVGKHQKYLFIYGISVFATLFDVSWFFSGIENFKILSVRNFVIKIISVLSMFILVHAPTDLVVYVVIQTLTVLFSNMSLWPSLLKKVGKPQLEWFSTYEIIQRLKQSLVFFIPQISISLYVTLNKVILGFLSSTTQTGYFDSSDKIVRLIFSMFAALSTIMLPRIANMYSNKKFNEIKQIIKNVINISLWVVFPIVFLIIANSRLIVSVLLGPRFITMVNTLRLSSLILIPMSVANVLGSQLLVPSNRLKEYNISVIAGALVNIIVDFPLISVFHSNGAAVASIISEATVSLIQIWYCRNMFNFKGLKDKLFDGLNILMLFSLFFIMLGLVLVFQYHMVLCILMSIIFLAFYVFLSLKYLRKFLSLLNNDNITFN